MNAQDITLLNGTNSSQMFDGTQLPNGVGSSPMSGGNPFPPEIDSAHMFNYDFPGTRGYMNKPATLMFRN